MKRIDSVNARPNVNGAGKNGFHDNNDISGQDATHLTPDWLNHIQEELCNVLELHGVAVNPNARDQLYQLLATNADVIALADAVEQDFFRKSQLNNTLTSNATDQALTAAQGKILKDLIDNLAQHSGVGLGLNQTWKDVTASRVLGGIYTNDSPSPIQIIFTVEQHDNDTETILYVDGIAIASAVMDVSDGGGRYAANLSAIVPPNKTFRVAGGGILKRASELS